ncbi:MAG: hypothetical protein VYA89_06450 [Actinomycetota bacterium]|nr:hypothetical protein [Actinomycetota bacterium]MED6327425.1 hypothetical protein [Actinomycetota bacterium]MEE2957926.1 hypothetical protein [Actinomycetota bacterium]
MALRRRRRRSEARRATYSRWDGTQSVPDLDADALLQAMGDELIEHGDPDEALRRMMRQGLSFEGGRLDGLRDVLERLAEARRERLESGDPNGVFSEVAEELREVIVQERAALDEAAKAREEPDDDPDVRRARQELDLLELEDLAGQVRGLQKREFTSAEAAERFEALLQKLREQLTRRFMDQVTEATEGITDEERVRMSSMLADLNRMLDRRRQGVDPAEEARDFAVFMDDYGDFFPEGPRTLDELLEVLARRMAGMQQVLNSMSPEQRRQMQDLADQLLEDLDLQWQVSQLGEALQEMFPGMGWDEGRDFQGEAQFGMDEALRAIDELAEIDRLEQMLRGASSPGALAEVDVDRVRDLVDDESAQSLEQLSEMARLLEDAGLVTNEGGRLTLTPKAIRRLGQNALGDLYRKLSRERAGRHEHRDAGLGHEREFATRPWEYGDPFDLDIEATLRNAVARDGAGTPVRLIVDDFAVEQTESEVRAATVLMLDLSLSMPMRGNFLPAKKTAMALHSLIAGQYPRDYLGVVTFSETARQIRPERLPEASWEYVYGTNMQHGLALARSMLAGQAGNRQVIMVTDGEPTAHLTDDGRPLFSYPPTRETVDRTLREVRRCTREGIRINVFMLDATPHLTRFVEEVTRLNGGRAFMTSNQDLGDYVLVDFVEHRRTMRSSR